MCLQLILIASRLGLRAGSIAGKGSQDQEDVIIPNDDASCAGLLAPERDLEGPRRTQSASETQTNDHGQPAC